MITDARDAAKYVEYYSSIESPQVREAFCMLVGAISATKNYDCSPWTLGGLERSIGIFSASDGSCPFSFVSNHNWLLFYFRLPSFKTEHHSLKALSVEFGEVNEKPDGERTIKLRSVDDVRRLLRIINIF
ncbi:hypothetical protein BK659_16020 [Pseudomonas brassicacearum]|uniref:YdhG-like domain-containing protein n=1 Tax=Pseudomonas brassicacearum TaxID=930166 RepID=A0A423H6Q9_9PSED|nr:hypothetical protein [Pseudomonas brassicacearum]RON08863.1 hypothetical protein BK659_16020 [Pseudomonas brassicacearum]